MPMSIVNTTTATGSGSINTLGITIPSGASAGDVLIIVALQSNTSNTVTWPSGFVEVSSLFTTEPTIGSQFRIATKTAVGGESGTWTVNWSGFATGDLMATIVTGVNATLETSSKNVTSNGFGPTATLTGASVSPSGAGRFIVWFGVAANAGVGLTSHSTPSGLSSNNNFADAVNGWITSLDSGTQAGSSPTTYSGSDVLASSSSVGDMTITLVFAPAGPPPVYAVSWITA